MRGYRADSYGDAFADVYDDWYAEVSDVTATVAALGRLAGGGPLLELGVGTGRLALPLAAAGVEVHGVDASQAMVDRLRAKPAGPAVHVVVGDMVDDAPPGPFTLVFVAYNTFFNLESEARQQSAMHAVASRLTPGGRFVVEAFVPEDPPPSGSTVRVRSMAVDAVVLSVDVQHPEDQRAEGHLVELTDAGGVRLRPWSIRWARPEQLDAMAAAAGLELEHRWETFAGEPFGEDSERHVSVYRRPGAAPDAETPVTTTGELGARTGPSDAVS